MFKLVSCFIVCSFEIGVSPTNWRARTCLQVPFKWLYLEITRITFKKVSKKVKTAHGQLVAIMQERIMN